MNQKKGHVISSVLPGSIAEELEIAPGDRLLAIDNTEIEDIFDYQFLIQDNYIEVLVEKPDGEQWLLEVDKEYDEDLGIAFENGLMDEYRSCHNKCIFCFIDQMPKGMRETLYFKDDDSRLSFLQGNYVTLTNMSDHDIDRIIKYHLSPINISFQTTNPELRCRMLNNRFAGESLKLMDRLYEAGTSMNGQIVLCRDINDKEELNRTIEDLSRYIPYMESVSVVPVGLSRFRKGLYPLKPFTKKEAEETIDLIESWQRRLYEKHGIHFVHASDEFYILAERPLPEEDRYDGYPQLENGVGMLRLLASEVAEALMEKKETENPEPIKGDLSLATGCLAYPYMKKYLGWIEKAFPGLRIRLYAIQNHFFGEEITVAGLITGQDIIAQLKDKELGEHLLLPVCMFRSGEEVFLDDVTRTDVQNALQVPVHIVKSSGYDLVEAVLHPESEDELPVYKGYEL